jgi:hypothetical protein
MRVRRGWVITEGVGGWHLLGRLEEKGAEITVQKLQEFEGWP